MSIINNNVTLNGVSKKQYTFKLYTLDTKFNPVKAIYSVWKLINNNTAYRPLYIWQTNSLSDRFQGHHKQSCFDRNQANCIWVMQISKQEDRDYIEEDLLWKYNLVCNTQLN